MLDIRVGERDSGGLEVSSSVTNLRVLPGQGLLSVAMDG